MARLLIAVLLLTAATATATDLRIETMVFAVEEEAPVSQSVTYFHDGIAYDFRPTEGRATIFRQGVAGKPARFVLLDTERGVSTEIHTDQLERAMSKLRRWAAMQSDPFLQFTGAPVFREEFDPETGELRMTSDQMSYRLMTTPLKHPEIGPQIRLFLDRYAQLHTLLEAGLPPEPRIKINEALHRHGVIPLEVELTARDDDEPSLRGEHKVAWVLSKQDHAVIDHALNQTASFQKVSNADFKAGRVARKARAEQEKQK